MSESELSSAVDASKEQRLRRMMRNYFIRSAAALCYEMGGWLPEQARAGNGQAIVLSLMLKQMIYNTGEQRPGIAAAAYVSAVSLFEEYANDTGMDPLEIDITKVIEDVSEKMMETLH